MTTPDNSPAETASRRDFLKLSALAGASGLFLPTLANAESNLNKTNEKQKPVRVAAIITTCFHRSHAHVILENFLQDYLFNGKRTSPGVEIVSVYCEQHLPDDLMHQIVEQFDLPMYNTIGEALCNGGDQLAVDAVLNIGEHGQYAYNNLGQHMYPRKRFFDEAVAVMKRSNRFVPLFNDKHLSYRWDEAKEMYDTAQELGIPLMAGSSVPLAQRQPNLELPPGCEITEAVSVHGGGVESYDFHALEVLQSMIENRKGGETGVSKVEFLTGEQLWQAGQEGRWDPALALAAMEHELGDKKPKDYRELVGDNWKDKTHGILLHYKDGLKAVAMAISGDGTRWNFSCRLKGDPQIHATDFYVGPWQNRNLFKALSHAIQHHFKHGEAPYPVERTLLTSGILDALMHSRHEKKALETPQLEIAYQPKDFKAMREMGATWKLIPEGTPQPEGIVPHGGL